MRDSRFEHTPKLMPALTPHFQLADFFDPSGTDPDIICFEDLFFRLHSKCLRVILACDNYTFINLIFQKHEL